LAKDQIYFGRNVLKEALALDLPVRDVFCESSSERRFVENLSRDLGRRVSIVNQLPKTVRKEAHQGVAFELAHDFYEGSLPKDAANESPRVLFCNHLEDVQNLGSIARSAAAFDFRYIVHESRRSFSMNAVGLKVSMGMAFRVRFVEVSNLQHPLKDLAEQGFQIVGLDAGEEGAVDLYDWNPTGLTALLLGSEHQGISRPLKKLVEHFIYIRMVQGIDSLNASQAANLAMSWAASKGGAFE
jgi:23S rRNA (guanosine2251-2'-O)-methyltransferase